jgi:alanine racemase
VYTSDQARYLSLRARRLKTNAHVHIKVDVGTMRLGFRYDDDFKKIVSIFSLPNISVDGVFSHFADSESEDDGFTREQDERMAHLLTRLSNVRCIVRMNHIACSAAMLRDPRYHYDAVRLGISLYGLWPSHDIQRLLEKKYTMLPVLSWKTRLIQIKKLKKGEPVGYGLSYRAPQDSVLGLLPVGYGDGFDRRNSNKADVLIQGRRCRVRGRVCMNLTMVNLPDTVRARIGDEVVLIGQQKKALLSAEELARLSGTINYEVVTRINQVIPRIVQS